MTIRSSTDLDALLDFNDPAATEARLRALLPDSPPALRPEVLTQLARAQGLQRRFAAAHHTLDEIEPLPAGAPVRARIRLLLERGRVHNSSGDPAAARPIFEAALALAESDPAEAFYAIDAAHMLAIVAPPDEALAWNRRALALAEAAEEPRARQWRGSLLNNIGWAYHTQGDYAAALDALQQAAAFRAEHGPAEEERIARWCVARVRRDLGHVAEALAAQRSLLDEYEALGAPSGYVYEEIGECLLLLGDPAAARPHFATAHALLAQDPWLAAEEPQRVARLNELASPSPHSNS